MAAAGGGSGGGTAASAAGAGAGGRGRGGSCRGSKLSEWRRRQRGQDVTGTLPDLPLPLQNPLPGQGAAVVEPGLPVQECLVRGQLQRAGPGCLRGGRRGRRRQLVALVEAVAADGVDDGGESALAEGADGAHAGPLQQAGEAELVEALVRVGHVLQRPQADGAVGVGRGRAAAVAASGLALTLALLLPGAILLLLCCCVLLLDGLPSSCAVLPGGRRGRGAVVQDERSGRRGGHGDRTALSTKTRGLILFHCCPSASCTLDNTRTSAAQLHRFVLPRLSRSVA